MAELFVRTTSIKTPCETYRCKNMNYIEIGVERGPANLTQRFCRECFVEVIRKAPAEIIIEALGDINIDTKETDAKISALECAVAALEFALATKTEEVEKLLEEATKPIEIVSEPKPDPEPETPSCGTCEKQFSKKLDDPCKSCKEAYAKDKVYIHYKAREKK